MRGEMNMRTKKTYNVSLDEERTEYVKEAIRKTGMSFSAFLDASIEELYKNLQDVSAGMPKGADELTTVEFLESLTGMLKRMLLK